MGWVPIYPPISAADMAKRAVIDAKRTGAQRRMRALYAREPWRDPASDSYDPLRVLLEKRR